MHADLKKKKQPRNTTKTERVWITVGLNLTSRETQRRNAWTKSCYLLMSRRRCFAGHHSSGITAIPLDKGKCAGLVRGMQSVCSKACPDHQKTGWDLFWCRVSAQGSHQEVGDFPNFMVPRTPEDIWAVHSRHQAGRLLWHSSHSSSGDGWKSHLPAGDLCPNQGQFCI